MKSETDDIPTPRANVEIKNFHPFYEPVAADFARQLERELAQAVQSMMRDGEHIAALVAENDRLRAALQRLADCDWVISLPDRMDAVRDIARAALAETKP